MPRTRLQMKQGGFSMSEALVSMTVLTSGLLGLAQFQGEMIQNGAETRTQTSALNLTQLKLEELRQRAAGDYDSVESGHDAPAHRPGDQAEFSRHWTVTPHASPSYKEVRVATAWTSIGGDRRSVSLLSLIAPRPPYAARSTPATGAETAADEEDRSADEQTTAPPETPWGSEATTSSLTPNAPTATCLCERGQDGTIGLDARSSDPDCTPSCCRSAQGTPSGAICDSADCRFVARCP